MAVNYKENLKTVLPVLIDAKLLGIGDLDTRQRTICEQLAFQNAVEFGPAVHIAQTLLDTIIGDPITPSLKIAVENTRNTILSNISIYPNPATEWLNVKVAPEFTDVILKIVNLSGQLVGQYPLSAPLNYLSVSNLSYGLYLLKFEDGKGNFETQKVFLGR